MLFCRDIRKTKETIYGYHGSKARLKWGLDWPVSTRSVLIRDGRNGGLECSGLKYWLDQADRREMPEEPQRLRVCPLAFFTIYTT